jgi:hypothetical protein
MDLQYTTKSLFSLKSIITKFYLPYNTYNMINAISPHSYPLTLELSDEEQRLLLSRSKVAEKLAQNRYENGIKEWKTKGESGK